MQVRSANSFREFFEATALHLAIPLRVFRLGHVVALGYILLLTVGAFLLAGQIEQKLYEVVKLVAAKYSIDLLIVRRLYQCSEWLSWAIVAPLLVTASALPTRLVFLHRKLSLFHLIKETPMALRVALQTILLSLRLSVYFIAAPLALLFTHAIFLGNSSSVSTVYTSYLLIACLAAWSFTRCLPFLLSPLFAVVGLYEPWGAVTAARETTARAEGVPAVLVLFMVGALLGVDYLLVQAFGLSSTGEMVGVIICLCFFLISLSGLAIRRAYARETGQTEATW